MPAKYRVRNWSEYNKSLIARGDITFIVSKEVLKSWQATRSNKRGRPYVYSEAAIQAVLIIRTVFRLPLRASTGFMQCLFSLLAVRGCKVPNYSTLSRRSQSVKAPLDRGNPISVLLLDSTGLRCYSASQWKRSKYGYSKDISRWRKLHIGMDSTTGNVVVMTLSDSQVNDCTQGHRLLKTCLGSVETVIADGAYDTVMTYKTIYERGAVPIIPPKKIARLQSENRNVTFSPALLARDKAIEAIRTIGDETLGKQHWKQVTGYHVRSRVENLMYRIKKRFGDTLWSKREDTQDTEMRIKCKIINDWNTLGRPDSYEVTT